MSTEIGVDVSKWQGKVDWDEAKHQIGFAMVKATQGTVEIDPDYVANIEALRRAGEHRGSYHYPNAGDAVAEADYYVEHARRVNGEMQALDFEGAVLRLEDPVGWAHAWLSRVIERTDNIPLIYMSGSVADRYNWRRVIDLNAGLWVASWDTSKPDPGQWPFVIMWQRDDTGSLRGISGAVDQDVFYGNAATWAAYANNRATPGRPNAPTPAPPAEHKPEPKPEPTVHVVVTGDSLWKISRETGLSIARLVELNRGQYPSLGWNRDLIQLGWKLRLS